MNLRNRLEKIEETLRPKDNSLVIISPASGDNPDIERRQITTGFGSFNCVKQKDKPMFYDNEGNQVTECLAERLLEIMNTPADIVIKPTKKTNVDGVFFDDN